MTPKNSEVRRPGNLHAPDVFICRWRASPNRDQEFAEAVALLSAQPVDLGPTPDIDGPSVARSNT
jgi:hypothetical protein